MSIWYKIAQLDELNSMSANTLAETLQIQFSEIGDDYLIAKMPVNSQTKQPYGLLHGGASASLAETIGSVASYLCINAEKQLCVGLEINCNHIRSVRDGEVTAKASPIHIGATTHVWDIRITDEKDRIVCVSRLTMAILKKPIL